MTDTTDLSDSEAQLIEAFRATDDSGVSERHLSLSDRLAEESGLTREYLLEASEEAVEAIAGLLLAGFTAGDDRVTANDELGGIDRDELGTGRLEDIP